MEPKLSYLPMIGLVVVTLALLVWYWLDVKSRKGSDAEPSPLRHPIPFMCRAARAMWHEQTMLFLVFALWVSGGMGGWVRAFMSAPLQARDDRRIGLFFFDPWSSFTALSTPGAAMGAILRSIPRLGAPFGGGYETTIVPAFLICVALAVALFVGVKAVPGKSRAGLFIMLGVGFVSVLLWLAIPWFASAAQAADAQHRQMAFRPSPQLLMILTLLLQAPLSALLSSFCFAALHQITLRGGWNWRQVTARAAAAFLPLTYLQLLVFVPLSAIGPLAATFISPERLAHVAFLPQITRGLGYLSDLAAVLLLYAGWIAVVEGAGLLGILRRNFGLLRSHAAATLFLVLRTTAVLVPLAIIVQLASATFAGSLAGRFVTVVLSGLISTLALVATASAYISLSASEVPAETVSAPKAAGKAPVS